MAKYKAKVNTKEVESKKNHQVKSKEIKNSALMSDEQIEIRNFFIILVVVILAFLGIFFLGKNEEKKMNKDAVKETETEVEIDYTNINVGTILNRPYEDYYVMVFDSESVDAPRYDAIIQGYSSNENAKKVFVVDLGSTQNSKFKSKDGKTNPNVKTDVTEFSFGEITLLYVKNEKVVNYYEDLDEIQNVLKKK